ncbi:MAG: hypothetical protein B193_1030 [Solidesulfovibrio magneticus str. Maddingley MBC34]|uniref:Uncharacterized protein n=1 Tax=Solidesulfovibrio magneticus str. Maddingley MBC34 TaxID=1206767 RepID=K6GTI0_9BACT|nr:MAG: hypothetical protein B193_1030 [Solidesulfovibrio magneticus str. Maddingley MBC34]
MNMYTTDLAGWLRTCGPDCSNDAHCLEQAVLTVGKRFGKYRAQEDDGLVFLARAEMPMRLCLRCADDVDDLLRLLRIPYRFELNAQRELDKARLAPNRPKVVSIQGCRGNCRQRDVVEAC